jgi:hypothetical protein
MASINVKARLVSAASPLSPAMSIKLPMRSSASSLLFASMSAAFVIVVMPFVMSHPGYRKRVIAIKCLKY